MLAEMIIQYLYITITLNSQYSVVDPIESLIKRKYNVLEMCCVVLPFIVVVAFGHG